MQNRAPYNINGIIRVYNVFQIVACIYFIRRWQSYGLKFRETWKCFGAFDDPEHDMKAIDEIVWWFTNLRLFEFIETVFFILRKKFDQVSFLHVYHHIGTVVLLFMFTKNNGGIMGIYIGAINSCVHVIMYAYYLLSSYEQLRVLTNLVKPFLTLIQIVQLSALVVQCVVALMPGCDVPKYLFALQALNILYLIAMFGQFFIKSFMKKKKGSTKKREE